jgi:hypothetical protein
MLSRQFNKQPSIVGNSYGTVQDQQPIVASRSSWSSPLIQSGIVNTNQQTQQYGQSYNQQPTRPLTRVFQPEQTRDWTVQPTSSGYRR